MGNLVVTGRWMFIAGLAIAALGGLVWLVGHIPGIGDLPGTIRIEKNGVTCIFPLLASIVASIVLTLVLNLVIRLINR